jgi:hypothetical protein
MPFRFLLLLLITGFSIVSSGQSARDYAVEIKSEYTTDSVFPTLFWPSDPQSTRYYIYRKEKADWDWILLDSNLTGTDSFYTDTSFPAGKTREYWVQKNKKGYTANGYIYCGVNLAAPEDRGITLLLIDSGYRQALGAEIERLIHDLGEESWEVHTYSIARTQSVSDIKSIIYSEWLADSARVKSVFLLGHIPVPYSGNINPDAHPEHQGAWPADVYYVCFDLEWTDVSVNNIGSARPENRNVPGDGKFDQDYIWPAKAKIALGRVDLHNMPAFGENDTVLLKRYLDKNHAYRTGKLSPRKKTLIDDHFGAFSGEAFAANAWRLFPAFSDSAVSTEDYRSTMKNESFLWSYGCGAGTYTSAGGIGHAAQLAEDSLLNPFTMLFGSYFGDWDNTDNFLRAPLASKGWGLISVWAGRPFWMFHHSALGEPLGFSAIQAQNAYPTFEAGYSGTYVHIALMGDPTLTQDIVAPVDSFSTLANCSRQEIKLSWKATGTDSVLIYRKIENKYEKLLSLPGKDSSWVWPGQPGNYDFCIRALRKWTNPSGSYWQESHKAYSSCELPEPVKARIRPLSAITGCGDQEVVLADSSEGSVSMQRLWHLGNGLSDTGATVTAKYGNKDSSYMVKLYVAGAPGCFSYDSLMIQTKRKPDAFFAYSNENACAGKDSLTITASGPYESYSWFVHGKWLPPGPANFISVETQKEDTLFGLLVMHGGCYDTVFRPYRIQQRALEAGMEIIAAETPAYCYAGRDFIFSSPVDTSSHWLIWDFGDTATASGNSSVFRRFSVPGRYQVSLYVSRKGTSCADTLHHVFESSPSRLLPVIYAEKDVVLRNEIITLATDSISGAEYYWSSDASIYGTTEHVKNFSSVETGGRFVWLYLQMPSGCHTDTAVISIRVLAGNAVEKTLSDGIHVFPNPARKVLYLEKMQVEELEYAVYDLAGRKLLQGSTREEHHLHEVNIAGLEPGVYLLSLHGKSPYKSIRIIVQ